MDSEYQELKDAIDGLKETHREETSKVLSRLAEITDTLNSINVSVQDIAAIVANK